MSAGSLRERVAAALHGQVYLNVSLTPPAWEDVAPLTQALFLTDANAVLAEVRAWLASKQPVVADAVTDAQTYFGHSDDDIATAALAALIDQTKETP